MRFDQSSLLFLEKTGKRLRISSPRIDTLAVPIAIFDLTIRGVAIARVARRPERSMVMMPNERCFRITVTRVGMALTCCESVDRKNQDPPYKFWLGHIVKDVPFYCTIGLRSHLLENRSREC